MRQLILQTLKGLPVATKKTGRPIQHDQKMSGGNRKTVDEERNLCLRTRCSVRQEIFSYAISTPIPPEKRQKAHERSGKIIKVLNQNEETAYDKMAKEYVTEILGTVGPVACRSCLVLPVQLPVERRKLREQ